MMSQSASARSTKYEHGLCVMVLMAMKAPMCSSPITWSISYSFILHSYLGG